MHISQIKPLRKVQILLFVMISFFFGIIFAVEEKHHKGGVVA